jgi:uncharacterized BrkB/YihY/UPF0761 family membrane protein
VLDVGWLALLLWFFVWGPGLIALRVISSLLLTHWLNWYSTTYGAFGIIIAIFFWIILEGTMLVLAAALSPALAERRDLRAGRA